MPFNKLWLIKHCKLHFQRQSLEEEIEGEEEDYQNSVIFSGHHIFSKITQNKISLKKKPLYLSKNNRTMENKYNNSMVTGFPQNMMIRHITQIKIKLNSCSRNKISIGI